MTTKTRDSGDKARVRFRYVEFDVEGGNSSIQEGLRNVAAALMRGPAPAPKALPPSDAPTRKAGNGTVPVQLTLGEQPDAVSDDEGEQFEAATDESSINAKPRQPRRYPPPIIVNGLDLDGSPSLEEFARAKAPDGHTGRYLVSAVWLSQQKNITEFTSDHAFTICKRLGWPSPPKDHGQPLRDLKKQRLMDAGTTPGTFVVNDAGIAAVERLGSK